MAPSANGECFLFSKNYCTRLNINNCYKGLGKVNVCDNQNKINNRGFPDDCIWIQKVRLYL